MLRLRLFAVGSCVLLGLFAGGAGARTSSGSASGVLGLVPALPGPLSGGNARSAAAIGDNITTNMTYHGGSVMRTNTTYAIYWLPPGMSYDANYESLINRYFSDVAHDSGLSTNVYAVDGQYYDNTGPIAYSSTFGGSWVDTQTAIPNNCGAEYALDYSLTVSSCVLNSDIQNEVQHAIAVNGWTVNAASMFFVFTPSDVGSCVDSSSGDCAYTSYCAYHSSIGSAIYANMPYADGTPIGRPGSCDIGVHPNNDWADGTVNLISHEHNEAITDPFFGGWYDTDGNAGEIGDKCAWNFGSPLGFNGLSSYNQVINSHDYYLQQEWSNASTGCAQGYAAPAAISGFSPGHAPAGAAVTITGTGLTGASALSFDGVSASFIVNSDTQITATVPAAATSGTIAVTTPGGTINSPSAFTVDPTIASFSPTHGLVGASVTINGGGFGGATAVAFHGASASFTVTSATQISATVPSGATSGTIAVTTPAGTATSSGTFTVDLLVLGNVGNAVTAQEGGSPVVVDSALTVTDQNSSTLTGATATISAGLAAQDVLAATTTGTSITASYSAGALSLHGTDTLAHYQQVLDSVTFVSTSGSFGDRTVTWAATDGTRTAPAVTSTVHYLTPPGAPTSAAATAGDGNAAISFTAPVSTGGAPISSYTVKASPGGATASGASSPITVGGLTDGTSYTFTVTATNAAGTGPASASSNAVTPVAAGGGGGGGSGGGGGGGALDLAVTATATPAEITEGGVATYRIQVADVSGALGTGLHLAVTLPAGAVLGSAFSDRGPGCAAGQVPASLDCNLDFLSGSLIATVTIVVTLPDPGQATLTASATAQQSDVNMANNSASVSVQVDSNTPPGKPSPPPARPRCTVPSVTGKTLAAAKKALGRGHCTVGHLSRKSSTRVAKGRVQAQSPRAGARLAAGGRVNLVLSTGKTKRS